MWGVWNSFKLSLTFAIFACYCLISLNQTAFKQYIKFLATTNPLHFECLVNLLSNKTSMNIRMKAKRAGIAAAAIHMIGNSLIPLGLQTNHACIHQWVPVHWVHPIYVKRIKYQLITVRFQIVWIFRYVKENLRLLVSLLQMVWDISLKRLKLYIIIWWVCCTRKCMGVLDKTNKLFVICFEKSPEKGYKNV